MPKVTLNVTAPNFVLKNYQSDSVRLSDFRGKQNVLLVFNRGFV